MLLAEAFTKVYYFLLYYFGVHIYLVTIVRGACSINAAPYCGMWKTMNEVFNWPQSKRAQTANSTQWNFDKETRFPDTSYFLDYSSLHLYPINLKEGK